MAAKRIRESCDGLVDFGSHRAAPRAVDPKARRKFACGVDGCTYTSAYSSHVARHRWDVHNLNDGKRQTFSCSLDGCGHTCKQSENLAEHRWFVHDINDGKRRTFSCSVDGCKYTCKGSGDLAKHRWSVHDINDGKRRTFSCSVDGCDYTCKKSDHLARHRWFVHNLNDGKRKLFQCPVDGCLQTCKSNSDLKSHLTTNHDIGDHPCAFCLRNVASVTAYKDQHNQTSKICSRCYRKATGYQSRAEKDMVESIRDNKRLGPFVLLTDKQLKGDTCTTKRRPDVLLSSGRITLFVECDEHQHKRVSYSPSCEVGRMGELNDEVPNQKPIHVRWNPDAYKVARGRKRLTRPQRIRYLIDYLVSLTAKYAVGDPPAPLPEVHYLFYDDDNRNIAPPEQFRVVIDPPPSLEK